ncbi:MAG TPA: hypothetical protein VIK31_12935 [Propionibacteriaceae bacterium]
MSDPTTTPAIVDYSSLGFVDNPFMSAAGSGARPQWLRLAANSATNRLLSATMRARERSCPVLVTMTEDVPEYYYRLAQNDFLSRSTSQPALGMMALNMPLDMMRLGRIRGTLAELAELVVAVDMPATLAAWYSTALEVSDPALPESSLVTEEQLAEAARLFADDPDAAVARYLAVDAAPVSSADMDVVVHEAYLRQIAQPVEVEKNEESIEVTPFDATGAGAMVPQHAEDGEVSEEEPSPDANVREYLLALARTRLSPVIARAIASFGQYGESLAAQELKITKAPRKTISALLRLMSGRWRNLIVIYDNFDAWPTLDQQTKMGVLASLVELRYLLAETGVMVVGVVEGTSPEIAEQFAAGEPVDWRMPELESLSKGAKDLDVTWVQAWLDAASLTGVSRVKVDGPELAPLVEAAEGDLFAFADMAEAAFRDAASRSADTIDAHAIVAGVTARREKAEG